MQLESGENHKLLVGLSGLSSTCGLGWGKRKAELLMFLLKSLC